MKYTTLTCLTGLLLFTACEKNKDRSDASGTFEAAETTVSAEVNGKVMAFTADEGDQVKAGQVLGYIDSTQLYLQKLQLQQNRRAVLAGQPNVATQLEALEKELDHALSDRGRVANLVKGDVASKKQLDDADTRIAVLRARIAAQRNELGTRNTALYEQGRTIEVQLRSVEDQLGKCRIESPLDGTVLTTYVNPNEMTAAGRPLFKVADLGTMRLKAYLTGDQFDNVKLGQAVRVLVDSGDGGTKEYPGEVEWISDRAEFTPKTIQTRDERSNLVHAIKVRVKNDGLIKIGMYGEVILGTATAQAATE